MGCEAGSLFPHLSPPQCLLPGRPSPLQRLEGDFHLGCGGLYPFHPLPWQLSPPPRPPRSRRDLAGVILSLESCSLNAESGLPQHPHGDRKQS